MAKIPVASSESPKKKKSAPVVVVKETPIQKTRAGAQAIAKTGYDIRESIVRKLEACSSLSLLSSALQNSLKRRWYATDLPMLDWVCGQGIPTSCLIELLGGESAGKTTLGLDICAYLQVAHGAIVIDIDSECSHDEAMMRRTGIDPDATLFVDENISCHLGATLKAISEYVEMIAEMQDGIDLEEQVPIVILWDSIGGTGTKTEQEKKKKGLTAVRVGEIAGPLTEGLKNITPIVKKNNVLLLACNQLRDVMNAGPYGEKERSVGGHAFYHCADIRLRIRRGMHYEAAKGTDGKAGKSPTIIKGGVAIGTFTKFKGIKNKTSDPLREGTVATMWKSGIYPELSALSYALNELGLVKAIGRGYIEYKGVTGQMLQVATKLRKDPELFSELLAETREAQGGVPDAEDDAKPHIGSGKKSTRASRTESTREDGEEDTEE